jgi:hypothetical protein
MTQLAAALASFVQSCRALISWRAMLLIAVATVGLAQFTPWTGASSQMKITVSASCEASDRDASAGIAPLLSDTSSAAELRLDEAILQLRRARKNCRAGATVLAEQDYASLQRTFPLTTGSVRNRATQAVEGSNPNDAQRPD